MITLGRHRPLIRTPLDEATALVAILDIAADAIAQFDPDHSGRPTPSTTRLPTAIPASTRAPPGVIWAPDCLHLRLFVLAGEIAEGQIQAGMFVTVPLDSSLSW
ncbi:hypothetical protein ACQR1H_05315 [Bradyrhizobium sp. HKCCYLRH2015]|uniref:hypothetical protein n=1 Tax=Bradyrhizobium sp. HKCCYLRH2015 TaxID=3420742 RepID=UPI003EBE6108